MHTNGLGFTDRFLTPAELAETVAAGVQALDLAGQRVLVIVPDGTRTMPLAEMHALLSQHLLPRAASMDYLIALGTHMLMDDAMLTRHFGQPVVGGMLGKSRVYNHRWMDPGTFVQLGVIPAEEIHNFSGGLFSQAVPVEINRLVLEYDRLLIVGPVFPHEIVGFSGGTKYFFPGIAGPQIINFTHWLGAVMTNFHIIGSGYTTIRAIIDRAAEMIPTQAACFALVVTHQGTAGIYYGTPQQAWTSASALSAQKHIHYVDQPFQRVISVMPRLYDDLWTGAKGMYKVEPAVADGGEVVIYAPHISEISYTHHQVLEEIGYHTRDYFLKQWPRFQNCPWGVIAHSTYVKGLGSYDPLTGIETSRIKVSIATAIPPERCRQLNLDYLDPASLDIDSLKGREDEGILVVPRAGEMLYRLREKV